MRSHWAAGQAKLRGKRYKVLRCGCCVVADLRPAYRLKLANKEIRLAFTKTTEERIDG